MRAGLILAVIVIVLDQISKWFVVERVMRPEGVVDTPFFSPIRIEVLPVLDIVMAWNRGVSFGMFNNDGQWNALILSILSLAIVGGMLFWMKRTPERMLRLSLGLIIGGALGNVIDRVRWGAVADFVYFHVGDFHWPAFNIADSAITVGAALLLLQSLFAGKDSHKNTV